MGKPLKLPDPREVGDAPKESSPPLLAVLGGRAGTAQRPGGEGYHRVAQKAL